MTLPVSHGILGRSRLFRLTSPGIRSPDRPPNRSSRGPLRRHGWTAGHENNTHLVYDIALLLQLSVTYRACVCQQKCLCTPPSRTVKQMKFKLRKKTYKRYKTCSFQLRLLSGLIHLLYELLIQDLSLVRPENAASTLLDGQGCCCRTSVKMTSGRWKAAFRMLK